MLPKVGFENSLAKKIILTWINPCKLIWHSITMIKLIIHEKKNSNQNVILQIIMKPSKFWNVNVSILVWMEGEFEYQNGIQKGVTFGSILKWVSKVSPLHLKSQFDNMWLQY